jgi:hypothetical protein
VGKSVRADEQMRQSNVYARAVPTILDTRGHGATDLGFTRDRHIGAQVGQADLRRAFPTLQF